MSRRIIGLAIGAIGVLGLSAPAGAFHGGGHGGGGGGGFHGGGGGGFRGGGFGGGYHPAGGYHAYAPAFNRTPSFSTPRSFESHYSGNMGARGYGMGVNPGMAGRYGMGTTAGMGRIGVGTPGFGNTGVGRNGALANREMGPNPFAQGVNRGNFRPFETNANMRTLGNAPAVGWHNQYLGYHQNWFHGYWNGHYPGGWGWRGGYGYPGFGYWGGYGGGWGYNGFGWGLGTGLGMGLGMGMGYGLSSWLFGPMLYNWGYANYYNPYWGGGGYGGGTTVVQQPIIYDYGQPINGTAPPPEESVTSQAMATFDQAREAFQQGDYQRALDLTDQSLKQVPNDPSLHEFRALALFAVGRYDEAAAALYAVLSVGPGWDWSTMIGLYGNPDVYTQQLRALESFVTQNRNSAAGRFVLAYHYLTQGHMPEAADQLRNVAALQPRDQLSAQLLAQLQQAEKTGAGGQPGALAQNAAAPSPEPAPAPAQAPQTPAAPTGNEGSLQGSWTAQPGNDTTITVSFQDKGHFTWKVNQKGQDRQFQGDSSYVNGILTLVQDQNNAMVGDLNWQDPEHFQFKVLGGGPSDPGLTFAKSP